MGFAVLSASPPADVFTRHLFLLNVLINSPFLLTLAPEKTLSNPRSQSLDSRGLSDMGNLCERAISSTVRMRVSQRPTPATDSVPISSLKRRKIQANLCVFSPRPCFPRVAPLVIRPPPGLGPTHQSQQTPFQFYGGERNLAGLKRWVLGIQQQS